MKFQELTHGKCAQDSIYIRKIDEIPQYVSDRLGSIRTGCNNKCSGKIPEHLECIQLSLSYFSDSRCLRRSFCWAIIVSNCEISSDVIGSFNKPATRRGRESPSNEWKSRIT